MTLHSSSKKSGIEHQWLPFLMKIMAHVPPVVYTERKFEDVNKSLLLRLNLTPYTKPVYIKW